MTRFNPDFCTSHCTCLWTHRVIETHTYISNTLNINQHNLEITSPTNSSTNEHFFTASGTSWLQSKSCMTQSTKIFCPFIQWVLVLFSRCSEFLASWLIELFSGSMQPAISLSQYFIDLSYSFRWLEIGLRAFRGSKWTNFNFLNA